MSRLDDQALWDAGLAPRTNGYSLTGIDGAGDPGGTGAAEYTPDGVYLRNTPLGSTDGYTRVVYAGNDGMGPAVPVKASDLMILTHVCSSTQTSGLGQPNNHNNPWQTVKRPDGTPVNFTASGATGAIRLRMWWKWATFDDAVTLKGVLAAELVRLRHRAPDRGLPREAFATDPQFDDPVLGNPSLPAPYIPVAQAVRTGSSGQPGSPRITVPNIGAKYRNTGIIGAVRANASNANSYDIYNGGGPNYDPNRPNYEAYRRARPRPQRLLARDRRRQPARTQHRDRASAYLGFQHVRLDGRTSNSFYEYTAPDAGRINDAFISLTLSVIQPFNYELPTPNRTVADWRDTFETGALSDKWHLGTTRTDQSLPEIVGPVGERKLRLRGEHQILHRYRVDLTGKSVVIGPIDYPLATESGSNFWFTLNSSVADVVHQVQIAMFTKGSAGGAEIRWTTLDEGYFASPASPGDPRSYVAAWDPVKTRYWRIREGSGILRFEVSPDKLRWTGAYRSHTYLPDQLRALQIHMYLLGEAEVTIDEVQPIVPPDTRQIPYEESWAFMGASVALRERQHGRDVLVGIADQGTTKAVRDAQNVTMVRRNYLVPAPANGDEIHVGAVHGCLVTPCGVPSGARFVEAVISGSTGTSTASLIMGGLLWLARQGAACSTCPSAVAATTPSSMPSSPTSPPTSTARSTSRRATTTPTGSACPPGTACCTPTSTPSSPGTKRSTSAPLLQPPRAVLRGRPRPVRRRAPPRRRPRPVERDLRGVPARRATVRPLPDRRPVLRRPGRGRAGPHARDTGQPTSEQGNGAYDLERALRVIGDSVGTSNIPAIAMPRFEQGQWAGVTAGLNQLYAAVEAQGRACLVRYAGRGYAGDGTLVETNASISSGVYGVVPWTSCDADTYAGMWDGSPVVTIPADGLYVVVLHLRYGSRYIDQATGNTVTATGAPYNAGLRGATILLNGTDTTANTVVADRVPAALDSDGATVVLTALLPLKTDDFLYAQTWQTSGATIQCLQNDYGGNWMLVARVAPLAPDLTGSLDPVTSFTALSTRFDQVTVAWTPPPTTDLIHVLIRRKAGATAPTSITDGDYVDSVKRGTTRLVDTRLTPNATYSYAAFARSPGGYSPRAIATVTTSVKPTAPAPVTNVTSSRRTTGNIDLAWTLPTNPDGNGVPRAGIQVRRVEGGNAPTTPEGGALIATLPPDATGYNDTAVLANGGKLYSYSIFTYRAEQVYSTPATHTRSTAFNTTIFGNYRPGDVISSNVSTSFGVPIGASDYVVMPPWSAVKYYGSCLIGLFFWVRRPALFKGFRFLRPKPNIGTVKASLHRFEADEFEPWAHRLSPDKAFPQTAAFTTWEEAILRESDGGYIPLTPFQIYVSVVMFESDLGEVEGFYRAGGLGGRGLMDPNGLLVTPPTYNVDPGDKAVWAEALGTYRPYGGNAQGSAFNDPYYSGPIPEQIGGLDDALVLGRGHYLDVIVNEI